LALEWRVEMLPNSIEIPIVDVILLMSYNDNKRYITIRLTIVDEFL
jgi:hypothetical protein